MTLFHGSETPWKKRPEIIGAPEDRMGGCEMLSSGHNITIMIMNIKQLGYFLQQEFYCYNNVVNNQS